MSKSTMQGLINKSMIYIIYIYIYKSHMLKKSPKYFFVMIVDEVVMKVVVVHHDSR